MINLNWLNTFCVLVEQRHFTETANKLFMTQSGVSQHIKKLEQQLEVQLLLREGKTFSVTEAGNKLYLRGKELLTNFSELECQVKQDSPYQGVIRVGSPGSVGLRLYPFLLELQQQYPDLSVDYRFSPNEEVISKLLERRLDIGLSTEALVSDKLVSTVIAEEPLVLVTPATVKNITWSKLIELGVIAHPDGAHHCKLLLSKNFEQFVGIEQFQQKGFSNQIGLILEPVSLGLGFTVLPMHAVAAFDKQESIQIHPLFVTASETLYLCCYKQEVAPARVNFVKSEIQTLLRQLT